MRSFRIFAVVVALVIIDFIYTPHAYAQTKRLHLNTSTLQTKTADPVANMLLQSMNLIGIPYKWGGNTPRTGLDCSGFIDYVYKKSLGIRLPRTAAEMERLGKNINIDELKPGDLLFFSTHHDGRITHVGMYIGNNKFIQAPHTGDRIKITEFAGFYRNTFVSAKRMVEENKDNNGNVIVEDYQGHIRYSRPFAISPIKTTSHTTRSNKSIKKRHSLRKKYHRH